MEMEMLPFRATVGRPLKYTPEQLRAKFAEYVQWCKDHPIPLSSRTTYANGNYAQNDDFKPRLVSLDGFEIFAGISARWWTEIEKRKRGEEFAKIKEEIKNFCVNYQKEMASAGIFNANIISRLLGLADRQQVEASVDYTFKFGQDQ